ncbi:hypothetical protein LFX13_16675 [Leptospira bandrabouensis]|nr:hypothetical protein [Leptospira bandrabouensis]
MIAASQIAVLNLKNKIKIVSGSKKIREVQKTFRMNGANVYPRKPFKKISIECDIVPIENPIM